MGQEGPSPMESLATTTLLPSLNLGCTALQRDRAGRVWELHRSCIGAKGAGEVFKGWLGGNRGAVHQHSVPVLCLQGRGSLLAGGSICCQEDA